MNVRPLLTAIASLLLLETFAHGEARITIERNPLDGAGTAGFKFKGIPRPARGDAAAKAKFTVISGDRDRNGGDVASLTDGRVPNENDQPSRNFFFTADGGRLVADLGAVIDIKQINSYSRHASSRGPQVYKLYASDGTAAGFNAQPEKGTDPVNSGWKLIGNVDSRPKEGDFGGIYGVSISNLVGNLGKYRYLLFEVSKTKNTDPFANTFFSEIDVIDANAPQITEAEEVPEKVLTAEQGKYRFAFDTSMAPDLAEWTEKELGPVVQEWYPKIVKMLPSDGYEAPTRVVIEYRDDMGGTPAYAAGNRISCNLGWFRNQLKGEARGAVVHELVHVAQQYGLARRRPNATRTPGWITEGIPDYIRWFLYEPQTRGAELTARNISNARYDASYRVTGNFLNWLTEKYDKEIVRKINAAAREGRYSEEMWKELTGKGVQELGDEWKKSNEERLAAKAKTTVSTN
ncbi:basic secretory protein-like protein [Verrucomicrobiota bacterium sgz303538]